MKKTLILTSVILTALLVGCTADTNTPESTDTQTVTETEAQATAEPDTTESITESEETTSAPETTAEPEITFPDVTLNGKYSISDKELLYNGLPIRGLSMDGLEITEIIVGDDELCFTVKGEDAYGEPVTITAERLTDENSNYISYQTDYSSDVFRRISRTTSSFTKNEILYTFDYAVSRKSIIKIGKYSFINHGTSLIENNEVVMELEPDYWFTAFDNFIGIGYGPSDDYCEYYTEDLKPIYDRGLGNLTRLPDGRYIAQSGYWHGVEPTEYRAVIFDADGNILYRSEDDRKCLLVDADYMLFRDADGIVRMYTPDSELLCEFPEWKESYSFHSMLSGMYDKEGKGDSYRGYYFVTEDYDDSKPYTEGAEYGTYGNRIWEFYYIPETGESGVLDNGYGEFAYAKPVLYLYPKEETEVTVTFEHPDRLTTVYPAYNGAWNVTAKPDGTLTDKNGRTYYCLYWEEDSGTPFYNFTDGFCVRGEDSAAFLEDALSKLGLTDREANEFIIYWLPIMERNEYSLIRFELTEERNAASGLNIYPAPDSILRMAMHIKAVDEFTDIPEQTLPTFERNGFVAVEWGGCVH